jgi:dimethylaniline monooxygenase (N-oxide forming)
VKPDIERLDGDGVVFVNGARERVDHIIYCTGYKVTFPFFRPEVMAARNNDLPLFKRVFHPAYRNLFFIGLLQPLGAIMPLAELQSEWVARFLLGEYEPPAAPEMEDDIQRERRIMLKRYGAAPRHTMQVDFDAYVDAVKREMKRGAKRAERRRKTAKVG